MNRIKQIPALLMACMLTAELQAQDRTFINWTRLSGAITSKSMEYYAEIENSYRLTTWQQDYFTVLTNARYKFKEMSPGLGLSYWLLYDNKGAIAPEWRPHLQFQWEKKKHKCMFAHRTRLENRFIKNVPAGSCAKEYDYTLRPRILFQAGYSLTRERNKQGNLQLVVSDEILLEHDKHTSGFAENRLYAGFWYDVASEASLQLGYMWVFSKDAGIPHTDIIYLTLRKDIQSAK